MASFRRFVFICLMVAAVTVAAQTAPQRTLLRAGHVLDVRTGKLADNQTLVISGGLIQSIAPTDSVTASPADKVIDLGSMTVLPGLIDVHTHLTGDPDFDPYKELTTTNAKEAITFYEQVFGARVVAATEMGGAVVHAELDFGNGHLQLGEPNPGYHLVPAPEGEDDCYSMGLYCEDADALVACAEAAGATIREPLSTFVSGDRYASIRDPFGVRWSIMTRVEDLSEEESNRRVEDWAAQQG